MEEQFENIKKNIILQLKISIGQALHLIGNKLQRDAVLHLRDGNKQAWDNLINSITYDIVEQHGLEFQLKFGTNVPYAKYVEEGRMPGRYPPFAPIKAWILQKRHKFSNFMADIDIDSATFLVARKLKEQGTKPYPFISFAINQNKDFITRKLNEAVSRATHNISSK